MSDGSSTPSRAGTPIAPLPDIPNARPYRFTWDQSSRRGPESVSGTTEGRGDYIAAKPRLDLFNASSSSSTLPLGAVPSEWSSAKHGFHAISTVLNNPHKRQAPPKAHSGLPAVPPADLPRVRRKDFDGYLRAMSPEWAQFEKNTQLGHEGTPESDVTPTRTSMDPASVATSSLPKPGQPLPSLEIVPQVFFIADFSLGDPRIFREVAGEGVAGTNGLEPSSLAYSLPLLEKLSQYADTVEQHLVQEISIRSSSFFAALTNLNELQTESEECLDRISKLRGLLRDIDEKGSRKGLQIVRKEARLANMVIAKSGVRFISGVMEMTTVAKGLVSAGQWSESLDIIEEIESLWSAGSAVNGAAPSRDESTLDAPWRLTLHSIAEDTQVTEGNQKHPSLPLSALQAFASLPQHLRVLSLDIASSLSSEVVESLRADLLDRVSWSSQHPDVTSHTWKPQNQLLSDRLRPLLNNLVRTKGVNSALVAWRGVILMEVKSISIRHIPGFTAEDLALKHDVDDEAASRPGLGNHLRSMEQLDFLTLLRSMYRSFLTSVEGLQSQGHIITEILGSISSVPPSTLQGLAEELSDILSSATELTNSIAASLIGMRSDRHASLDLPEFLQLFNESWNFVVKCEVICRRMIVGLRGVAVGQAKVFLQTFHQQRLSRSAKLVEDEQWNPTEISAAVQHVTNIIVDSAVHDSTELVFAREGSKPINGPPAEAHSPIPPTPKPSSSASKHLRIEERTYYAVSATTETLALLVDYIRLVVNFSILTTDTMSRVIEFMKAFNSRTCQVVLGAGAMRSAGLKNITAKHLALASQSLSIMIVIIPYVRETFRRHLSSKQAIMLVEFDKLKRDYQEHQNEIHDKLIAIMGDRLTVHIKSLQGLDWSAPNSGGNVNDYMEILVKETVTLHKVLTRYLPTPTVEYVMSQVLAAINHRLSEEYGKIELPHQEAKTRLLVDAKFLHQKLSALRNIGAVSSMLETVVSEKDTPRSNHNHPSTPTASPLPSGGLTANQRLKGLLSGKSVPPTPAFDKALPTPTPMFPSASTPTSIPLPNSPPAPKRASTLNGRLEQLMGGLANNQSAEKAAPALPHEAILAPIDLKQIESPGLPEKQHSNLDDNTDNTVSAYELDITRPDSEAPPTSQSIDGADLIEPVPPVPEKTGSPSTPPS